LWPFGESPPRRKISAFRRQAHDFTIARKPNTTPSTAFEAKRWLTADKLRNNMDAAEPSRARQPAKDSPKALSNTRPRMSSGCPLVPPPGQVIDVFAAAGLKMPNIGILDDQFLAEVRGLKFKNVAAEAACAPPRCREPCSARFVVSLLILPALRLPP